MNKLLKSLLVSALLVNVGFSAETTTNNFTEKDIDKMLEKLNYQEEFKINTNISDPFYYKNPEKKVEKTTEISKTTTKTSGKEVKKVDVEPEKIVKKTKKVIIDYQGIIIDKALINSKLYKVGDLFLGAEITDINPNSISLKQNNFVFEINKKKNQN